MQAALATMAAHSILFSTSATSYSLLFPLSNPNSISLQSSSFHGVSLKNSINHHSLSLSAAAATAPKPLTVLAAAKKVVAVLKGTSNVEGVVTLTQEDNGPTTVNVKITGLTPGPHGFHLYNAEVLKQRLIGNTLKVNASNVGVGSGGYAERDENGNQNLSNNDPTNDSRYIKKVRGQIPYPISIALVLCGCALVFSLIAFQKGAPSTLLAAISKSGFTAAFTLIFVSEIGDKTFFIAALLSMQYEKGLVILGSMTALSLMSILSVVIGRIFNSVPAQFQTTLPIGEYAAVTLLMFFGLKAIKDAWDLPSSDAKDGAKSSNEFDEFAEAEELVKEKASKQIKNPFEVLWKSFSLVFFAEWGDRSMLATIALGAAQSPWGVASGAIAGHLLATSIAAFGGAFLANYISEKLVGYLGGVLFLLFAVATFLGVF